MSKNILSTFIKDSNVNHVYAKTHANLRSILVANNYNYIVYYNSKRVYDSVKSAINSNMINSFVYEVYHSDFSWDDALSNVKSRDGFSNIISVSEDLANDITNIKSKYTVPVGIDLDVFAARPRLNVHEKTIGVVSRLSKEKNVSYALDLAKKMGNFRFVIIGDGPERKSLELRCSRLGLDNVSFLGYIRDVAHHYSSFDGLLMPSTCSEGTPISILEAMACQVPVFSSTYGGISGILTDRVNGFSLSMDPDQDCLLISDNIGNKDVVCSALEYVAGNHDIKMTSDAFSSILLKSGSFHKEGRLPGSFLLRGYYA